MNIFEKTMVIIILLILLFAGIGCVGNEDAQDAHTESASGGVSDIAQDTVSDTASSYVSVSNPDSGTEYGFTDISVEQAKQMIDNKEVFLLDVRTSSEFNDGHIEGATMIEVSKLRAQIEEVPEDMKILVYCRTGRRSVTASKILLDEGYTEVYNVLGGINSWKAAKYPVVT